MEYILKNWSELNLVDRAWFLVGAWLLILFLGVFVGRVFLKIGKKKEPPTPNHKKANH